MTTLKRLLALSEWQDDWSVVDVYDVGESVPEEVYVYNRPRD